MTANTPVRRVAVYLFVVAVFLTLSVRSELQDRQVRGLIHGQRVTIYHDCLLRRANIDATISLRDQLAAVQGAKVATVYDRFPLIVPDCGRPPK